MNNQRQYPLEFRREEVAQILRCWDASEAASVVGIGSVGKSNLIQHLARPEVKQTVLGAQSDSTYVVVVDANMLGPLPSPSLPESQQFRVWAGFELIMHRIFLALYPFPQLPQEEAKRFYDAYQMLQDGNNPLFSYMGVRYLELGLEYFLRKNLKIVLVFDEFEELLRQMPPKFFQILRGLRDSHKSNFIYTVFSRSPIPVLVERYGMPLLDMEPFVELFTDNVIYVGPYNEADGRQMLATISRRRDKTLPELANALLLEATGRFAGLLRGGFNALAEANITDWGTYNAESVAEVLIANQAVKTECASIWTGLNRSEQYVLKAVAKLHPYTVSAETELAVSMLVQKRLLRVNRADKQLVIEPPVFRQYVRSNPEAS